MILLCLIVFASCKTQSFEDFESQYIYEHFNVQDVIETYTKKNIKMYLIKEEQVARLVYFENHNGNYQVEEICTENGYGSYLFTDAKNTYLIIFYVLEDVDSFRCNLMKDESSKIEVWEENLQIRQQHIFYYVLDRDYQQMHDLTFESLSK